MEEVMRDIWPFYGVMFVVLMLVTYMPALSLWLPALVIRRAPQKIRRRESGAKSLRGGSKRTRI